MMCRCASMNPGMALMPLASMTCPAVAAGAPDDTDAIFPPRTTIDPRSITVPFPTMMRTLVRVRSWAASGAAVTRARSPRRAVESFMKLANLS